MRAEPHRTRLWLRLPPADVAANKELEERHGLVHGLCSCLAGDGGGGCQHQLALLLHIAVVGHRCLRALIISYYLRNSPTASDMMLKRAQEIYEPEVAQLDDAKRLSAFQV